MKLAIVGGCGRLGLSMAVVSAQRGHDVICADVNQEAVDLINKGGCPISENGVAELIKELMAPAVPPVDLPLLATLGIEGACKWAEMIFITVPTPSLDSGRFDVEAILLSCNEIGKAIEKNKDFKTVVVVSTVNPGDCEGHIIPILELVSQKEAGAGFGFVYSPEFIRQGSIMKDFQNPDIVLIGQHEMMAGNAAWRYYSSILENIPQFFRMNLINAEITKLGLNTALVAKLAMANQITWLCHKTKGADAEVVLEAIGTDSRIGKRFFKPGLPPGGPCLPRDGRAFHEAGHKVGIVFNGVTNERWYEQLLLADAVHQIAKRQMTCILGMTYKLGVDIEEESAGKALVKKLRGDFVYGDKVTAFDPMTDEHEAFPHIVDLSQVLVITTPHEFFKELEEMDLTGKVVFDCWGLLDESKLNCEKYIRLGRGE